jgi:hypothetical protein
MTKILITADFWECDCTRNFIHSKIGKPVCHLCETSHEECPDARIADIDRILNEYWNPDTEVDINE